MPTALTDLVPRVVVQALGCPEPFALQALQDAAIEFCREALPVIEDLAAVTVTQGDGTYTLSINADRRVVQVMRLTLDGTVLTPVQPDRLPADWTSVTGTPIAYFQRNDTDIVLYPTPDAGGSLVATVAVAPSRAAASIDDILADRWLDGLVAGALAKVLLTANQPYSDPARGAYFKQEFGRAKVEAGIVSAKGYTRAPLRVQMQSF